MKNLLLKTLIALTLIFTSVETAKSCHAIALVNASLTMNANSVTAVASSNSPTCGCAPYWMDIEVRCMGEPFDAAPFNPGFHGPLANYPYFQSAQMNKPNCVVQPYPSVNIPFTGLCPGIQYQVRMRENHHGQVGPWTAPLTFTVPGTIVPLTVNATATQINICEGDCVDLEANVTGGCDLAVNYTWSNGSNNQSTTVCPMVTTNYTVDVFEQCSNLTTQANITINVVPNPIAGTASAQPTTVCEGQTSTLSLVGYDGGIQWQSAPGPGGPWTNIAGATNDVYVTNPINNDICFRAEVGGCGPSVFSNVVCVTVAPLPVLTVSNETICEGETTSLTTTVDLTGGTYSWNPTGQTSQNLTNVSPNATTVYEVTYDLNGCVITESGTVTVLPQPTTLNLVDQTICSGDNATFTANPDVAGGNYLWSPGGEVTNAITVSPAAGNYTYSLNYNVGGCEITETVDLTVNQTPQVTIDNQEICLGETMTMTAVPDVTGGDFVWGPGGEVTNAITVSPNATTNYDVTYTSNGCTATANATLTVHPIPVASFNFDNVCEDILTTLTSTSNVNAPSVIQNHEWDILDNGTIDYTNANESHDFNGWGTYPVTLTVTTNAGCTASASELVEVYPLPTVDFSATPLCLGSPTDFNDLTVVPNGGFITAWDWDFADGNGDNIQHPSHTYAAPAVYPVNLAVVTNNGCVGDVTNNVEIFSMPVANFAVDNECFYDALNFTNQSVGNASIFNWNFGDGNTSNLENPSHTYAVAGQYNVTLNISTIDGCGDEIILPVTAYAQPNAAFSVDPTCFETNSAFIDQSNVSAVDGDAINQWQWSFGDGNNSNLQNPNHNYGNENVYNVSLTVTTNHGCVDTQNGQATVWPLPEVNFSPTDVCLETPTVFNDLSTVSTTNTGNVNTQWSWSFGDGATSNQQNPTHTYSNDGQFNASLMVTTNNGCSSENTLLVTVHPKPVASFTGENLTGCSPVCFTLNSTSVVNNPSSIVDYTWTLSNGVTYNSTDPSVADCFVNNTSNSIYIGVELTVVSNLGCSNSHFEPSFIEVYHNPIASFTFTPDKPDVYDATVTFINSSLYADNYNWNISDYGTSNDHSPVVDFPLIPETYDVELITTTNEGCSDTAYAVVDVLDRIIFHVPNTFTPDFDDYNQFFTPIFISGFDPYDYNLLIFNRFGEIIFESNDASIGWDGTYGIESNDFVKDGTYIWKIEFKETMTDKRHVHTGHVNLLR